MEGLKFPQVIFTRIQKDAFRIANNPFNSKSQREKSMKEIENYLVERGSCAANNIVTVEDIKMRLFTLEPEALSAISKSPFTLNADFQHKTSCLVDAVVYQDEDKINIHEWLKYLKIIGEPSVEGVALASSFTLDSKLFVIKVPQDTHKDRLAHEAVIGFYATNQLRSLVPNFMFVYGYTKCTPPLTVGKEAVNWCNSGSSIVSYLINENIQDSISLNQMIKNPNLALQDFLDIFLQVINALNQAYKIKGFIHYDLHSENVLVREFTEEISVPYYGTSNKVLGYISNRFIPFIIDYGMARIKISNDPNEIIYRVGYEEINQIANQPNPLHDIYKLLGFLAETVVETKVNPELTALINELFSFFEEGSITDRVALRNENLRSGIKDYYILPNRFNIFTHDDYLNWMANRNLVRYFPLGLSSSIAPVAPLQDLISLGDYYRSVTNPSKPIASSREYCTSKEAINNYPTLSEIERKSSREFIASSYNPDIIIPQEKYQMDVNLYQISQLAQDPLDFRQETGKEYLARIQSLYFATKRILEGIYCTVSDLNLAGYRELLDYYSERLALVDQYLRNNIVNYNIEARRTKRDLWIYGDN